MKKILCIGHGEVGGAHCNLLSQVPSFEVKAIDINPEVIPEKRRLDGTYQPDLLLIAIRYSETFVDTVTKYIDDYKPQFVNVLTTVPPGTCMKIGSFVTHSTTRGLHPHLEEGLLKVTKHVGGAMSENISPYFRKAGIPCYTHGLARTTELLHILNNAHYGVNLMFADEAQRLCREYGVDYFEYMIYTSSNNAGYEALDQKTKVRPILTPPNGRIGGHCVNMSAGLIPKEKRTPILDILAGYGGLK